MSQNVMKVVRVTEEVHQRLASRGKIGDTYNDVIEKLLDETEEYEEYLDLLEADKEIENGLTRSYSDLDDFRNDIKNNIPFESRNMD